MARKLHQGPRDLETGLERIGETRGKELMVGIEVVKNKRAMEPAPAECVSIPRQCAEMELIVGAGAGTAMCSSLRL